MTAQRQPADRAPWPAPRATDARLEAFNAERVGHWDAVARAGAAPSAFAR